MEHEDADVTAKKVRENRLRRMATRYGLVLHKSRVRDWRAPDYGSYWLTDRRYGGVVLGRVPGDWHGETATLDDIERYLTEPRSEKAAA
jgi:hypothetical protein